MIFNSGTRAWYSDLEWIAGYPTRNQVGATMKACVLHLESTHAYTYLSTLSEAIPASKCGRMAVYESISGHIHILLMNSGSGFQRSGSCWT